MPPVERRFLGAHELKREQSRSREVELPVKMEFMNKPNSADRVESWEVSGEDKHRNIYT